MKTLNYAKLAQGIKNGTLELVFDITERSQYADVRDTKTKNVETVYLTGTPGSFFKATLNDVNIATGEPV